jgi:hypothetical protein
MDMDTTETVIDKNKFENTVLAILKAQPGIGSLQLRKALVIADALHYSLHNESITGANYIKHKYGPVPEDEAYHTLMAMDFPKRMIEMIEEPRGRYTRNSYIALSEPDYSGFTESQIKIIEFAARTASRYSAAMLSDMTHDENYAITPKGGVIGLESVCRPHVSEVIDTPAFTAEEKKAAQDFFKDDENSLYVSV